MKHEVEEPRSDEMGTLSRLGEPVFIVCSQCQCVTDEQFVSCTLRMRADDTAEERQRSETHCLSDSTAWRGEVNNSIYVVASTPSPAFIDMEESVTSETNTDA
jgi:hypothetical protein